MKKCVTVFLCTVSQALFLTACARYEAESLAPIKMEYAPHSQTVKEVSVACKALSKNECKRYLGRDVVEEGYQPVQITVTNDSNRYLLFSTSALSLPCASPDAVAQSVHTSTWGRAAAYGVGALFLWPLAVPAIVDGVSSSNANLKLDNDYQSKSAHDQVIQPYSTTNAVIFVPTDSFEDHMSITLIDKASSKPIHFELKIAG